MAMDMKQPFPTSWRFMADSGMYICLLSILILFPSLAWMTVNCYPHPQTLAIDGTYAVCKVTDFPSALIVPLLVILHIRLCAAYT